MTNEVQQRKADPVPQLVKHLESSFAMALPAHVTKEHFARALMTEFRRTPALCECTRESLGAGVMLFAQLGLLIGVNGNGWLLPFNNNKKGCKEAVVVIGYQGKVDLCYRSDRVESIFSDVVCENDTFEFEQGLNQKLRHVPILKNERGDPYAVYALASIKGSSRPVFVVLNKSEVMAVKNASFGAKKSDSPWNGAFEIEMWKKTALHRLTKVLPKSIELMQAMEFENRQEEELKEVEATVIDDPLAPGRHEMKKKTGRSIKPQVEEPKQEPATEETKDEEAPWSEIVKPDDPPAQTGDRWRDLQNQISHLIDTDGAKMIPILVKRNLRSPDRREKADTLALEGAIREYEESKKEK